MLSEKLTEIALALGVLVGSLTCVLSSAIVLNQLRYGGPHNPRRWPVVEGQVEEHQVGLSDSEGSLSAFVDVLVALQGANLGQYSWVQPPGLRSITPKSPRGLWHSGAAHRKLALSEARRLAPLGTIVAVRLSPVANETQDDQGRRIVSALAVGTEGWWWLSTAIAVLLAGLTLPAVLVALYMLFSTVVSLF